MRRTLPLLVTATMLFAACSSSDDTTDNSVDTESTDADSGTDTDTETSEPLPDDTVTADSAAPPPTNPAKPEVEIPDEIPEELQVTVLEEGTGPEAQAGDTVLVDYVGVRSADGVEFDNSYDRFQPFSVVLGEGRVIAGWDQGLVGAQAGSRLQLDIPSDLAYGPDGSGEIIGPDEALTFIIDVRAVVSPGEEPTEPGVDVSEGATEITVVDLVEGEGPEIEVGQLALIRFVLFRGDNGVVLQSSWSEQLQPLPLNEDIFPPLYEGLQGMQVGGRRAITFPPQYPDFGFGPEGNPTGGLPAETDVTLVVDLVGAYDDPTAG
jgi:peptidylprolyl isomerase